MMMIMPFMFLMFIMVFVLGMKRPVKRPDALDRHHHGAVPGRARGRHHAHHAKFLPLMRVPCAVDSAVHREELIPEFEAAFRTCHCFKGRLKYAALGHVSRPALNHHALRRADDRGISDAVAERNRRVPADAL